MRLFVAVCLTPDMKQGLNDAVKRLRRDAVRGNFTRPENFHLTLAFIGEADPAAVRRALEPLTGEGFTLRTGGLGWFRGRGGDIAYVRCEESRELSALQKQVRSLLKGAGFRIDEKPFRAHLTLGREVQLFPDFDEAAFSAALPEMTMEVSRVSLMKSERIGGKLTYSEVWGKEIC